MGIKFVRLKIWTFTSFSHYKDSNCKKLPLKCFCLKCCSIEKWVRQLTDWAFAIGLLFQVYSYSCRHQYTMPDIWHREFPLPHSLTPTKCSHTLTHSSSEVTLPPPPEILKRTPKIPRTQWRHNGGGGLHHATYQAANVHEGLPLEPLLWLNKTLSCRPSSWQYFPQKVIKPKFDRNLVWSRLSITDDQYLDLCIACMEHDCDVMIHVYRMTI